MRDRPGTLSTLLLAVLLVAAAPASAQKKPVIGVSLASQTNPLYVAMEKGIRDRAAELGVEVRFVVANEDQARQVNGVQDLLTQRVDAILISPISVEGAQVAYEEANKAGVPILSIARNLNKPQLEWAMIGKDWKAAGHTTAEWLAKRLGGKGRIAVLAGPAGASFAMEQVAGLREVVGKHPGMEIVATANSPLTKEQGIRLMQGILTANPRLDAVFAVNDELALGAIQATEEVGRAREIVFTGFNGAPAALEAVRAGKLHLTTSLKPYSWGVLGLDTALRVAREKQRVGLVEIRTQLVEGANVNALKPEDLR
ncbi:MAG: substrate-binding domain-containing protein [Candidatus Rokubacteria bacterium]|nr:substrate-binding domain-containing protein [Candidatus Rokubacteria bacterium]